ncbi:sialate O-acetylesterase [Ochrobactrum sp. WV_118_8]
MAISVNNDNPHIGFTSSAGGGSPVNSEPILILASGQSNMAYVYDEETNNVAYADNLHYWNFPGWDGEVGTSFRKPAATEVSVAMCLGNEIAKTHPGRKVYVVNVSFGGTALSAWSDNTPIAARDTLVANVQAALSHIGINKPFDYFFWWQGENDTNYTLANQYTENYLRFMEALDSNDWFDWRATQTLIFGIMDAPRVEWATNSNINRILRALVSRLGGSGVFVPTATLAESKYWLPDGEGGLKDVHMSSLGYETISKIASVALRSGGASTTIAFDDDPYSEALRIYGRGINFGSGDFDEIFDFKSTDGNGRMSTFRTAYYNTLTVAGGDVPGQCTYTRNSMWAMRSGETTFFCGFLVWEGHTGSGAMTAPVMPYDNVMGLDLPIPVHVEGVGNTKPVVARWRAWTKDIHFYEQEADGTLTPLILPTSGSFSFQTIGFLA